MEMESTRRPFDRSLSKEPGLKKPRLNEEHAAPDRSSNVRAGFTHRPMLSNSGGGPRVQRDRDSESSDSVRGPYQNQPGQQLHQELVEQYKTALSELTFNSKPIITNLTIIAGENLHAAKAIAATVCAHILEVPREQKLPSLYLLDSIVKNIGRDYIKYFSSRLPEVFCKAYSQVDSLIHQGMRHLFGTWKGVFPSQSLQMIEEELGFTTTANGSSTGTTTSRPDTQAQRSAHSIHVNPKYLESRQQLQTTRLKQNFLSRSPNGVSRSRNWKNSEEEEYMWDEMNARPSEHAVADISAEDNWTPDNYEKLDVDSHRRRPQGIHDLGPRVDDEASTDSIPTDIGQVASGTQVSLSWSEELHPPEGRMLLRPGKNVSGYPEGYSGGLKSSTNAVGRTALPPQRGAAPIGGPNFKFSANMMPGPKISIPQQRQNLGTTSKPMQSTMHQHPPSPSVLAPLKSFPEHNQTSTGPPTDPRRPPGPRNTGSRDKFSQDSPSLPSRDVYQSSAQRFQPQSLRTTPSVMPPLQQRKHVPSTQQRKLEVFEFGSSGDGQSLSSSQISGSESHSTAEYSSSDQSNPVTVDSPGQSITNSLLTAVAKGGILGSSSPVGRSTKTGFQEVGHGSSSGAVQPPLPSGPPPVSFRASHGNTLLPGLQKKLEQPSLPPGPSPSSLAGIGSDQTPSTVISTSDPVSSLISSLVAKGLISASKSDAPSSASIQCPSQPLDSVPGVSSASSAPDSSVPVTMGRSPLSITDGPFSSKPAAKASDSLQSTTKIKNLIGFEFKPDVIRKVHTVVVTDILSDLLYQCGICGLRLKLQEALDRHMEWHALRVPEENSLNTNSRRWYSNSVDWVAGVGYLPTADNTSELSRESGEALESGEQMVPADENQCACILCGELFEDFYSQERDEWMFRGAVYLVPSPDSQERIGTPGVTCSQSPIVHANCMSTDFVRDLGLASDIKLEKDA